jgi:hypothetical protein
MAHFEKAIDRRPVERAVPPPSGGPELYHLGNDPTESNDLAGEQPDRVAAMRRELENWFDEVNAERHALPDAWPG